MNKFTELLNLTCENIKKEKGWKNKSRIIGESIEECILTINCPICQLKELMKYQVNEKSRDIYCNNCKSDFQVKGTKTSSLKKDKIKLLGAEYKTTCNSLLNNNINYLIVLYSENKNIDYYNVEQILLINYIDIENECIIPRTPLKSTARRAGWQGCYLVFNKYEKLEI